MNRNLTNNETSQNYKTFKISSSNTKQSIQKILIFEIAIARQERNSIWQDMNTNKKKNMISTRALSFLFYCDMLLRVKIKFKRYDNWQYDSK